MTPDGTSDKRRYGRWSGQPDGVPENLVRCVESVYPRGAFVSKQCRRYRGFGLNGEYCKQHAEKMVKNGSSNS